MQADMKIQLPDTVSDDAFILAERSGMTDATEALITISSSMSALRVNLTLADCGLLGCFLIEAGKGAP